MNLKATAKRFGKKVAIVYVGFVVAAFFGLLEFAPRHSWQEITYIDKILGTLYFALIIAAIWSIANWVRNR